MHHMMSTFSSSHGEMLQRVDVWARNILRQTAPLLPPNLIQRDSHVQSVFETQWCNLRQAVLFCLRHLTGQHKKARLDQMDNHFQNYAERVQASCMSHTS
eukprot:jgi/Ulvmu1/8588/UM045_0031.1